jgi:hypothetical protein
VIDDDMDVQIGIGSDVPVMAAAPRTSQKGKEPAESGRPETAKEFASCMHKLFVLRGPGERKEGGSTTQKFTQPKHIETEVQTPIIKDAERSHLMETLGTLPTLPQMLSTDTTGIDFINGIQGKYRKDPFYKNIIDKPKDFRNFEVTDGLVYRKEHERTLLCIPDIRINERSA